MVDVPLAAAPAGVDQDAWDAACAAVRAYCGWHVAPSAEEDVVLDGSGSSLMFLPTLRLTALADVTDDGAAVDPEWSAAGMVRKSTGGLWSWKFRSFTATMTHGYEACPPEILAALTAMVATAGMGGVSGVTSGSHQVQFEQALSPQHQSALDHYRLASVK